MLVLIGGVQAWGWDGDVDAWLMRSREAVGVGQHVSSQRFHDSFSNILGRGSQKKIWVEKAFPWLSLSSVCGRKHRWDGNGVSWCPNARQLRCPIRVTGNCSRLPFRDISMQKGDTCTTEADANLQSQARRFPFQTLLSRAPILSNEMWIVRTVSLQVEISRFSLCLISQQRQDTGRVGISELKADAPNSHPGPGRIPTAIATTEGIMDRLFSPHFTAYWTQLNQAADCTSPRTTETGLWGSVR